MPDAGQPFLVVVQLRRYVARLVGGRLGVGLEQRARIGGEGRAGAQFHPGGEGGGERRQGGGRQVQAQEVRAAAGAVAVPLGEGPVRRPVQHPAVRGLRARGREVLLGGAHQGGPGALTPVRGVDEDVDERLAGLGAVVREPELRGADGAAVGGLGEEQPVALRGGRAGQFVGHAGGGGHHERQGGPAHAYDGLRVRGVGGAQVADQGGHAADVTGGAGPAPANYPGDGRQSAA